ncbi:MAG: rRNA maturation RNase YbeY [Gammaproteobacteria bacterium RIFCSPHIGHO2_12_FULL_37_14]|nr:MAG: rRNA maturation RNase YbeY [Gammaproteobacteria bacterium RIFCSPHIGHO2_12_FULL_37_14]
MYRITIQYTVDKALVPKTSLLRQWAKYALRKQVTSAEITIRIVDLEEIVYLNTTYRHKQGPTNVLSFPFSIPKNIKIAIPHLGDIIICAAIVNREATEQNKTMNAHWAHMIIHGIYHLLGFDHQTKQHAKKMESQEIEILQSLGFTNPYKL